MAGRPSRGLRRRFFLGLGWTLVMAGLLSGLLYFAYWYDFVREVTWESWTVALPSGGALSYAERSPRRRLTFGPSDKRCLLLWTSPDGKTVEYPLGYGGYDCLSARAREDGKAVWVIDSYWKGILATLDLQSGELIQFEPAGYSGGSSHARVGTPYDRSGSQTMEAASLPEWATLHGGKVLEPTTTYQAR